jgi:hypothetical protein
VHRDPAACDQRSSSKEAFSVKSRKEEIRAAADCFPRFAGEIERAYEQNGEFRSICSDLLVCSRALTYWSGVDTDGGAARREEYGELLESLKQEVLDWLGDRGFLLKGDTQG